MMRVVKMDKRNTGNQYWRYYVEGRSIYTSDRRRQFYNWREWCWSNWGPSKELHDFDEADKFDEIESSNPRWCWLNKDGTRRIYVRNDQLMELFTLRWA